MIVPGRGAQLAAVGSDEGGARISGEVGALGIDEQGHAFIARQISNTTLASGLNFKVGRIDGWIYGAMVLRDVEVRDTKGAFAHASEIAVDWRPFSYFANRIDASTSSQT